MCVCVCVRACVRVCVCTFFPLCSNYNVLFVFNCSPGLNECLNADEGREREREREGRRERIWNLFRVDRERERTERERGREVRFSVICTGLCVRLAAQPAVAGTAPRSARISHYSPTSSRQRQPSRLLAGELILVLAVLCSPPCVIIPHKS